MEKNLIKMETISDYTIYCTPEQIRKASELKAPITLFSNSGDITQETADNWHLCLLGDFAYIIPTAEQMIGWLEEQKIFVHIAPCVDISCSWHISSTGYDKYGYTSNIMVCKSRKEATLAAIDSALEYLIEKKDK